MNSQVLFIQGGGEGSYEADKAAAASLQAALGNRYTVHYPEIVGAFEDDPNLTNKRFPGNPTKSYPSNEPLRVTGEVAEWQPHPAGQLNAMKEQLERLKQQGIEAIED